MRTLQNPSHVRHGIRRGFTLIELLLVMVIIAILAGIVIPKFVGQSQKADKAAAIQDLSNIQTALDAFEIPNKRYPTTEEGLQALVTNPGNLPDWSPLLSKFPMDPWKHAYVYRCPGSNGKAYDLYSCGPSGNDQQGGGDNVSLQN